MAREITMPRLSDSMEEGTILQWLVAEGDRIEPGQPLVEIETDKATVAFEALEGGTVLAFSVREGASVPVGAPIAVIGAADEALPEAPKPETMAAAAAPVADDVAAPAPSVSTSSPPAPSRSASPAPTPQHATVTPPGRAKASPLARRLAAKLGIDLAGLAGSGPNGRVIRADVERAAAATNGGSEAPATPPPRTPAGLPPSGPAGPPPPGEPVVSAKGEATVHRLDRRQQTVARRMAESRATVPDFELRADVDMTGVVELRDRLREATDTVLSFNDFLVKAVALALRDVPRLNASYREGAVETYGRINVGIAVAADEALVVPTIFDADRLSLGEISRTARELAARVRDGSISPGELAGGTFTVSNLGMYGVDSFSAVINPPQAAILSVGSVKPRPVVLADGTLAARPTALLTLACDHRVLYGADGARFLDRLREFLERRPDALLL